MTMWIFDRLRLQMLMEPMIVGKNGSWMFYCRKQELIWLDSRESCSHRYLRNPEAPSDLRPMLGGSAYPPFKNWRAASCTQKWNLQFGRQFNHNSSWRSPQFCLAANIANMGLAANMVPRNFMANHQSSLLVGQNCRINFHSDCHGCQVTRRWDLKP